MRSYSSAPPITRTEPTLKAGSRSSGSLNYSTQLGVERTKFICRRSSSNGKFGEALAADTAGNKAVIANRIDEATAPLLQDFEPMEPAEPITSNKAAIGKCCQRSNARLNFYSRDLGAGIGVPEPDCIVIGARSKAAIR